MKKWICLALCLLMLLPMTLACKKEEQPEVGSSDVTEQVLDDGNLLNTIPAGNYGGKEFVICAQGEHEYEFKAEELTGDLANDALYTWIQTINGLYGVQVKYRVPDGDYFETQAVETTSGTVTTSIYAHNAYRLGIPVIAKLYKDWNSMGSMIDLTAPRWDVALNASSTYNGKLFGLNGNLSVSKMLYAMATFYNVDLLDDIGYTPEELCEIVDDGEWTFDMFEQVVKDLYEDRGNKGRDIYDVYGYMSRSGNSLDIWLAQLNMPITSRDGNNTITPAMLSDRNATIVQRLCNFYYNNTGVTYIYGSIGGNSTEADTFRDGTVGMVTCRFSRATMFAEMGVESFGILPGPKWEETDEYCTSLHDRYAIYGVSKSIRDEDVDFIAHITDALCAESTQTVYPQFYDVLLKQRYSKDPDTARMVDIIMKNVYIDTAFQFADHLELYPFAIRQMIIDNNPNIAGSYATFEQMLPTKLQQIYDAYK